MRLLHRSTFEKPSTLRDWAASVGFNGVFLTQPTVCGSGDIVIQGKKNVKWLFYQMIYPT